MQARKEKETAVQENLKVAIDEKIYKVNELNKRNEQAIAKVKRAQKRMEIKSVKEFRKDMLAIEEKKQKDQQQDNKANELKRRNFIEVAK